MIDQLIIGEKASFDDFGASLAERKIGMPSKKSIKETVPFSNITYDFSAINGEVYWEERVLEYVFEIIASTPERLEELKAAFADWVMGVMGEELHDPFIQDHHFVGTYDDMSFSDEETLDKTTVTVKFTAYPYKVANYPTMYQFTVESGSTQTFAIENNSSHRVTPTLTLDASIILTVGDTSYAIEAGEINDESLQFDKGVNTITVQNSGGADCNITIAFCEEVF